MITQVPALTKVSVPEGVIVQTPDVDEVKVGVRPLAVVDAVSVGDVPKVCAPGLANVIVCCAAGVTELVADDAAPVPMPFEAVTVNVCAIPLVSPVTVIGLLAPVAVAPPGLAVTV